MIGRSVEDTSISATTHSARAEHTSPVELTQAPFARVEIFDSIDAAAQPWSVLELSAGCTPYQTQAWVAAWCATVGQARRHMPLVVVAFDAAGRPVALLPLVRRKMAGLRIAGFAGSKDSNANLGLFADPLRWNEKALRQLLRQAGENAGLDLFVFRSQPAVWMGRANPMLMLPHLDSPSRSWSGELLPDPERTLSLRLSKHARKLLRQKESRLLKSGDVERRRATSVEDIEAVLTAYTEQKKARAIATGIAPPSVEELAFLRRAALETRSEPSVEWHALWCGSTIVAAFAGAIHRQHFSGMVLSFDSTPDIARCSPAEILIKHVMVDLCQRGFMHFDLGMGDARYKATFCATAETRHDSFVGVTVRGTGLGLLFAGLGHAKRRAKASQTIRRTVQRWRAWRQAPPDLSSP